jgi:hypothetical protein
MLKIWIDFFWFVKMFRARLMARIWRQDMINLLYPIYIWCTNWIWYINPIFNPILIRLCIFYPRISWVRIILLWLATFFLILPSTYIPVARRLKPLTSALHSSLVFYLRTSPPISCLYFSSPSTTYVCTFFIPHPLPFSASSIQ